MYWNVWCPVAGPEESLGPTRTYPLIRVLLLTSFATRTEGSEGREGDLHEATAEDFSRLRRFFRSRTDTVLSSFSVLDAHVGLTEIERRVRYFLNHPHDNCLKVLAYVGRGREGSGDWEFKDGHLPFDRVLDLWEQRVTQKEGGKLLVYSDSDYSGHLCTKAAARGPNVFVQASCGEGEIALGKFTSLWVRLNQEEPHAEVLQELAHPLLAAAQPVSYSPWPASDSDALARSLCGLSLLTGCSRDAEEAGTYMLCSAESPGTAPSAAHMTQSDADRPLCGYMTQSDVRDAAVQFVRSTGRLHCGERIEKLADHIAKLACRYLNASDADCNSSSSQTHVVDIQSGVVLGQQVQKPAAAESSLDSKEADPPDNDSTTSTSAGSAGAPSPPSSDCESDTYVKFKDSDIKLAFDKLCSLTQTLEDEALAQHLCQRHGHNPIDVLLADFFDKFETKIGVGPGIGVQRDTQASAAGMGREAQLPHLQLLRTELAKWLVQGPEEPPQDSRRRKVRMSNFLNAMCDTLVFYVKEGQELRRRHLGAEAAQAEGEDVDIGVDVDVVQKAVEAVEDVDVAQKAVEAVGAVGTVVEEAPVPAPVQEDLKGPTPTRKEPSRLRQSGDDQSPMREPKYIKVVRDLRDLAFIAASYHGYAKIPVVEQASPQGVKHHSKLDPVWLTVKAGSTPSHFKLEEAQAYECATFRERNTNRPMKEMLSDGSRTTRELLEDTLRAQPPDARGRQILDQVTLEDVTPDPEADEKVKAATRKMLVVRARDGATPLTQQFLGQIIELLNHLMEDTVGRGGKRNRRPQLALVDTVALAVDERLHAKGFGLECQGRMKS